MKKMRKLLCLALALAMVLALAACGEAGGDASGGFKVTFYDSDGTTVLAEVNAEEGQPVAEPELSKEGYVIQGYYATPALVIPYDMSAPVTEDTSVFVAWQSSVADERAWMLAGSLAGYPDNNWGHAWPQDDYLLQPVEGEFNTFAIEINLYEGDQFKIAVIDQDYNWGDSIDASHLVESEYFAGGEDAFNSGANITVAQSGLYKLVLKTDAETISLCSLSAERLGDAAELAAPEFDFQLQGTFNNWGEDPESFKMLKNGDDNIWYYLLTVTEEDYDTQNDLDAAMFGVNAQASLEDNVEAMTEAFADVKTGEVTTAIKDSKDAEGNAIADGDVIGIADGAIHAVGHSVSDVVMGLLEHMEADDCDTCTLLAGEDLSDEDFQALQERIEQAYEDLEIDAHRGDQPLYPIVFSVE